jgi:hypothetical protein
VLEFNLSVLSNEFSLKGEDESVIWKQEKKQIRADDRDMETRRIDLIVLKPANIDIDKFEVP